MIYHFNANYIIFKNLCDRTQIRHLVRQVYPDDPKFLKKSYYDATSRSYVLLARSETIKPEKVSILNVYFSRGCDSLIDT